MNSQAVSCERLKKKKTKEEQRGGGGAGGVRFK